MDCDCEVSSSGRLDGEIIGVSELDRLDEKEDEEGLLRMVEDSGAKSLSVGVGFGGARVGEIACGDSIVGVGFGDARVGE